MTQSVADAGGAGGGTTGYNSQYLPSSSPGAAEIVLGSTKIEEHYAAVQADRVNSNALLNAAADWYGLSVAFADLGTSHTSAAGSVANAYISPASTQFVNGLENSASSLSEWATATDSNWTAVTSLSSTIATLAGAMDRLWQDYQTERGQIDQLSDAELSLKIAQAMPADQVGVVLETSDPGVQRSALRYLIQESYTQRSVNEVMAPLRNAYMQAIGELRTGAVYKGPKRAVAPSSSGAPGTGSAVGPGSGYGGSGSPVSGGGVDSPPIKEPGFGSPGTEPGGASPMVPTQGGAPGSTPGGAVPGGAVPAPGAGGPASGGEPGAGVVPTSTSRPADAAASGGDRSAVPAAQIVGAGGGDAFAPGPVALSGGGGGYAGATPGAGGGGAAGGGGSAGAFGGPGSRGGDGAATSATISNNESPLGIKPHHDPGNFIGPPGVLASGGGPGGSGMPMMPFMPPMGGRPGQNRGLILTNPHRERFPSLDGDARYQDAAKLPVLGGFDPRRKEFGIYRIAAAGSYTLNAGAQKIGLDPLGLKRQSIQRPLGVPDSLSVNQIVAGPANKRQVSIDYEAKGFRPGNGAPAGTIARPATGGGAAAARPARTPTT